MSVSLQKSLVKRLNQAGVLDGFAFSAGRGRSCDPVLKQQVIDWAVGRNPNLASEGTKFAEIVYWLVHNLSQYPKSCLRCNTPVTHFHSSPIGYKRDYCSVRCAQLSPEVKKRIGDTLEAKHGARHQMHIKHIKEKMEATNIERYGAPNPLSSSIIQNKVQATIIREYGVDNVSKHPGIKAKKSQTSMKNFGVPHSMQSPIVKAKTRESIMQKYGRWYNNRPLSVETNLRRYGVENVQQVPDIKLRAASRWRLNMLGEDVVRILDDLPLLENLIADRHIVDVATDIGISYTTLYRHLHENNIRLPPRTESSLELRLQTFLTELGTKFFTADRRIIRPLEIDIVLPDHHIGIEVDGIYWHHDGRNSNTNYHLNKTIAAEKAGYRLMHIFEDELQFTPDIVLSKIAGIVGCNDQITADDCVITIISENDAKTFLDVNHLEGGDTSLVQLGLSYDNELCAVMTFNKSSDDDWEISRYATSCGTDVVNGATKLFNHFVKTHYPTSVIAYADRRYPVGNLYEDMGFVFMEATLPDAFFVKGGQRQSKSDWKNRMSPMKLKGSDVTDDEAQALLSLGYDRIWDCGMLMYGWHKDA